MLATHEARDRPISKNKMQWRAASVFFLYQSWYRMHLPEDHSGAKVTNCHTLFGLRDQASGVLGQLVDWRLF